MTPEIEALAARITQQLRQRRLPEATYRLQFHAGFTFRDACAVVPYLRGLGVTHAYASPFLKARPGSTHGYDIIDHSKLNPEIGSDDDFAAWVGVLHEHDMGQVLDIVPNHMGIVGDENPWWNDVLENGPASPYATFFDIAWTASPRPELHNCVLLPILGDVYGKVLESGQLRLALEGGAFAVYYFDHRFPVDPGTFDLVLGHRRAELETSLPADDPALAEYDSILTAVGHLPDHAATDPQGVAERQREKEVVKRRLASLLRESEPVRTFVEQNVILFNGTPGDRRSFDPLHDLLERQAYRLCFWRVASDEINYRRFFDVNELAALSTERPEVFEATHELPLRLIAEGSLDGLRVDHPDGLFDPHQYLRRLQRSHLERCARAAFEADPRLAGRDWDQVRGPLLERVERAGPGGPPLYVVVEKILAGREELPDNWSVHGTTGYDFLNMVNGLFVDASAARPFTQLYHDWIGDETRFAEVAYRKKQLILRVSLSSELYMLAHQLDRLAQKDRWSRDFTLNALRLALREVIACFPVYRSYTTEEGVREADRRYTEVAVRRAMARNPTLSPSLFRFVQDMLLLNYPEGASEEDRAEQRRFAGKFQQVTAPVTAKGTEDTAFYVYNRLVSLNEVGGEPDRFGVSPEALHRYNQDRQARWPYSLSPLSTHDTKRSEDVRARLNVLSEMPDEWGDALARWGRLNEPHRRPLDDLTVPAPNDEYLIYQTLVGACPFEGQRDDFVKRIQEYVVKALHEAKEHSSWVNPNDEYDLPSQEFVARILDEKTNGAFLDDFRTFQRKVARLGMFNGLAQTLLRIVSPGVPDTYQGTEVWSFSLVDPDNRRPVDYPRLRQMLSQLQSRVDDRKGLARELLGSMEDGRVKLYVTWEALCCRRDRPGLFSAGDYLPTEAAGAMKDHVFGFVRRRGDEWAVAVVPRLLARLAPEEGDLPLGGVWEDTELRLPEGTPAGRLRHVFTGEVVTPAESDGRLSLPLAQVFAQFPVALFIAER